MVVRPTANARVRKKATFPLIKCRLQGYPSELERMGNRTVESYIILYPCVHILIILIFTDAWPGHEWCTRMHLS